MLELGQSGGGGSLGRKLAPAIWGKTGTITKIEQKHDQVLGSFEPDLFITIHVDSGGQWEDEIDVFGAFKRDERTGEVIGWGSAFKVDRVLDNLGCYDGLSDEQKQLNGTTIPAQVLQSAVGKQVQFLLYCAGKNRTKDKPIYNEYWDVRLHDTETDEQTFEEIKNEMMNDDYHAEKVVEGRDYLDSREDGGDGTDFNYGANAPGGGNSGGGSLDDNLPI